MSNSKVATPASEQDYLRSNAILALILGLVFTLDLWSLALSEVSASEWLTNILIIGVAILFFLMLVYLVKASKGAFTFNRKAFWLGTFNDEYLNHINLKGYKYAFNITCGLLIALMLMADFNVFEGLPNEVTLKQIFKSIIGLVFWGYAIPVLYMLRGEDE